MKRAKLVHPSAVENRRINAGIKADRDTHELTAAEIASMKPWRPRGRPKAAVHKLHVNVRLDPEVIDYFQNGGPGWQTRLNDELVSLVRRRVARKETGLA